MRCSRRNHIVGISHVYPMFGSLVIVWVMRNTKVLEIVSGLGMGGAEKALQSRLNYQPKRLETLILNLRPQIDVLNLPEQYKVVQTRSQFLGFFPKLRKLLLSFGPDVVIVRTPFDAIRIAIFKTVFFRSKWKLLFEAHNNYISKKKFANPIFSILLKVLSKKVDCVVAVSKNVLSGPQCVSKAKTKLVYLGADINDENAIFPESTSLRLLFLGRLTDVKRPMMLLEAIATLSKELKLPHNFLIFVGDGHLRISLETFVQENNLGGIVKFYGHQADVSPYLLQCTHLISVSSNEGLPISFFEAKLAGMRIISTPSGGGSEIFDSYDHELRTFDLPELVEHLGFVLGERITSASRLEIANRASWMTAKNCSANYYNVLEDLLEV
jgi:glycosyltransferase involved in cell wall biosynthesis